MKKLIIAAAAVVLMGSVAAAQTVRTEQTIAVKKKHYKKHRSHAWDGYYRPGIPRHDPGRYSNLPGKDAAYSKAFIQDH